MTGVCRHGWEGRISHRAVHLVTSFRIMIIGSRQTVTSVMSRVQTFNATTGSRMTKDAAGLVRLLDEFDLLFGQRDIDASYIIVSDKASTQQDSIPMIS